MKYEEIVWPEIDEKPIDLRNGTHNYENYLGKFVKIYRPSLKVTCIGVVVKDKLLTTGGFEWLDIEKDIYLVLHNPKGISFWFDKETKVNSANTYYLKGHHFTKKKYLIEKFNKEFLDVVR